jgi:hypothetical protein
VIITKLVLFIKYSTGIVVIFYCYCVIYNETMYFQAGTGKNVSSSNNILRFFSSGRNAKSRTRWKNMQKVEKFEYPGFPHKRTVHYKVPDRDLRRIY